MTRSVGTAFARGDNNFDAIRLVAAFLVLFSHSYPLTRMAPDPLVALTGGHTDGGRAAVAAFFVISGFLVTRSVLSRDPAEYVRARMLRILPALLVVTVFQTFVIGLCFTTLPWRAYLADPGTWAGLRNATVFDLRFRLPGLFETNPYPDAVNGSMWTLPLECGFYLVLPLLALLGLLRRHGMTVVTVLGFAALAARHWLFPVSSLTGMSLFWSMPLAETLDVLPFFLLGAALWVHRDAVSLNGGLAACCLLALFASAHTLIADFVFHVTYPYLVIYVALARPCTQRWLRPVGDISYGAYLYAFPVQQAVVAWHVWPIGPEYLALIATPIVLVLALLSCHLIERPALRLKAPRRWRAEVPAAV